jgi:transposase
MKRQSGLTASAEEWRRRQAVELRKKGWTLQAIAEALGVTSGAVCQWLTALSEQGEQGLMSGRSRTGRRPKLSQEQVARLVELLDEGAEEMGHIGKRWEGKRWEGKRVAALIRRELGVSYLPGNIPRLLRRLGWTPQKPQVLASQRNEQKIEQFKEDWQEVKKGRRRKAEPSSL